MRIFKIIYYIFLSCLAIIALLLVSTIFPITGNFKVLVVQSGSMEPAVRQGGIVVIKPATEYHVGDVITFGKASRTEAPTTHRIFDIKVEQGKTTYITKGDANNGPDKREIASREIIGKVLFNVPYVGYAIDTAKKPWGFILIIVIPALIIIYDEGVKIWKEIKRVRNKKTRKRKIKHFSL
ncbi:signal peptidase I [Patescibacteria group bacterium]|nr:signal peptidase I [Patescibacteria group bacterium]MBU4512204.1 signal peptidase I [Patescibacteria group bacterium]MCG2693447.1 signal peptidase I [Candidatus Parcubacteria bacterium]